MPNRAKVARGVGEKLLYSIRRNEAAPRSGSKLCRGGSLGHAWPIEEPYVPTNVTLRAKTMTNRARNVAAGVVSGAGPVSR